MGWTSRKPGFDIQHWQSLSSRSLVPVLELTHRPLKWVPSALSQKTKRPAREAHHTPHPVMRLRMREYILLTLLTFSRHSALSLDTFTFTVVFTDHI